MILQGNHEEIMVEALEGDLEAVATGSDLVAMPRCAARLPDRARHLPARARAMIPRTLIRWLETLPRSYQSGDVSFIHAGIRPGVALKTKTPRDQHWIAADVSGGVSLSLRL